MKFFFFLILHIPVLLLAQNQDSIAAAKERKWLLDNGFRDTGIRTSGRSPLGEESPYTEDTLVMSCVVVPNWYDSSVNEAFMNVLGGTEPYQLTLSGPIDHKVTIKGQNFFSSFNLPEGAYEVKTIDAKGLEASCSFYYEEQYSRDTFCASQCIEIGSEIDAPGIYEWEFEYVKDKSYIKDKLESNTVKTKVCPTQNTVYTLFEATSKNRRVVKVIELVERRLNVEIDQPFLDLRKGDNTVKIANKKEHWEYEWSDGSKEEELKVNEAGIYTLRAKNKFGCVGSKQLLVLDNKNSRLDSINLEALGFIRMGSYIEGPEPKKEKPWELENICDTEVVNQIAEDLSQSVIRAHISGAQGTANTRSYYLIKNLLLCLAMQFLEKTANSLMPLKFG